MDPDFDAPRPSSPLLALVLFGVVTVLFFTVGAVTQVLCLPFGLWFSEVFVFLAVGWVGLRWAGRSPVRFTGLGWPGAGPLLTGFVAGLANFLLVIAPLQWAVTRLVPAAWREADDQSRVFADLSSLELALVLSAVTVAAPLCEEFFFRGVFQRALTRPGRSPWPAVLVTAFFFALFHFNRVAFLGLFEVGVLFGLLAWRTGSLWPAMLAHSANNLVSSVAFLSSGATPAEAPPAQLADIAPVATLGLALAVGWVVLVRAFPALLPVARPAGDAAEPAPRSGLWPASAPWMAAGLIALAALGLVDGRGVRLRVYEVARPLPEPGPDASERVKAERELLRELRARVRRGEAPFEEWVQAREGLGARRAPGPQVPPPVRTEPVAPVPGG